MGRKQYPHITLPECTELEGLLYYQGAKYIPNHPPVRLRIIQQHHNASTAGHPGRDNTFDLVSWQYYWPKMRDTIAQYVRNCHECKQAKPVHHKTQGVLRPLPIHNRSKEELSMDFVTRLSESNGFNAVIVIVDRLTKQRHLVPCHTTANAEDVAKIYLREVWKQHALPTHITSHRGTQFVATFWKYLCQILSISPRISTG
jgi:hypothetical protein